MPGFFILSSRIAKTSNNPQLFFLFLFGLLAFLNNFRLNNLGHNRFRSSHFLFNADDGSQHLIGFSNNTDSLSLYNHMDHNFNQFSRRNFLEVYVKKLTAYRVNLILLKYRLFRIILELEIYNNLLSGCFA